MANEKIPQIIDAFNQLNFDSCRQLADTNEPNGNYLLGYCYEHGIGVEKDENKAFTYYQKSADLNNSNGMYQVAYCYYLGIGVEIDKHKAFTYYLKSAEAGNSMGIWKTAWCYYYGIGVEENWDKWLEWSQKDPRHTSLAIYRDIEPDPLPRKSEYGKCAHCNEDNTQPAWCLTCDPEIATRWTSGNKNIDDCMKAFQLRTVNYEDGIEWIPFDRLSVVEEIGKGGFGSVYKTTWLDGIRKVEKINDDNYRRAREPPSIVALKTLSEGSLKEFEIHMLCILNNSRLKIYGLTQSSKNNKYFIVLQYADHGDLHKFLRTNFQTLTWATKLNLLYDIFRDLYHIHYAGYIHADFHSGNILQNKGISTTLQSYIADLGLSKKAYEDDLEGEIFGVMPYVAPEVLKGEKFKQAADIYGFGVIMSEMSTGQRPFDGQKFDIKLAVKICKGLKPEFAPGTPDCYIELANRCLDLDPKKRPFGFQILEILEKWNENIKSSDDTNEIKKQFLEADKVIKSLPISKHPDEMYTSKIISTKLISKKIKNLSQAQANSAQKNLDITKI